MSTRKSRKEAKLQYSAWISQEAYNVAEELCARWSIGKQALLERLIFEAGEQYNLDPRLPEARWGKPKGKNHQERFDYIVMRGLDADTTEEWEYWQKQQDINRLSEADKWRSAR